MPKARVRTPTAIAGLVLLSPCMVDAQDDSADFCPARPGQTTPSCVLPRGATMFEAGLASWSRQSTAQEREDLWAFGDLLLRRGVGEATEVQLAWRALAHADDVDARDGRRFGKTGAGDVALGVSHKFGARDGPVALQAFVVLPTGDDPGGAGDWGAGLRLPVSLQLGSDWTVGITPEIDAAVNASGDGRHAAFVCALGAARDLGQGLSAGVDVSVLYDDDPAGATTTSVATVSLAWQPGARTQFDLGIGTGLTHDSIDGQAYLGFAIGFKPRHRVGRAAGGP